MTLSCIIYESYRQYYFFSYVTVITQSQFKYNIRRTFIRNKNEVRMYWLSSRTQKFQTSNAKS
jgi:hypothetical protein